jgi:hypothetical protein
MKKIDFIKNLKEVNQAPTTKDIETASKNVEALTGAVKSLGDNMQTLKDMGIVGEDFDASKNYETEDDFYKAIIDHLMYKKYRMTYFNPIESKSSEPNQPEEEPKQDKQLSLDFPKEKEIEFPKEETPKPISQMSDSEFNDYMQSKGHLNQDGSLYFVVNLIKKGSLRRAYIALQDIIRKNLEENFADSKIFTIIAEAETPKISKKEILEYLKRN